MQQSSFEECSLSVMFETQLTLPEFHTETEAKADFPAACIQQRRQKPEQMLSILNYVLSWATTSPGNKFRVKNRPRLMKALNNRFNVKLLCNSR